MAAMTSRISRRAALTGGVAAAGAWLARPLAAGPRLTGDPFTLGVTSGSPTPTGIVLWTRLAPEPLHGGGMPDERVEVRWEVASDERFARVVRSGTFVAIPELAHSVHAEVEGLEPGRAYFYRFHVAGGSSPVGRTRTLPAPDARVDRLRLGYASCQHFEQGFYAAHRHLADEALDLMVFLGDYIYESSWGDDRVRRHSGGEVVTRTLAEYRDRHAQYKADPDLQALHAAAPWVVIWDDHEVVNDYAGDRSERLDFDFGARRAAAYRAFWEHMPLRMSQLPRADRLDLYGSLTWGRLARLHLLDGRQYKTPQACPKPGLGGGNVLPACPGIEGEDRSVLGRAQERWLDRALVEVERPWSVVAQPTLVAPVDRRPGPEPLVWTDGWDGYPAARRRLLASLARPEVGNPLVIGGDIHMFVAADLRAEGVEGEVVAAEVCGTSITSQGLSQAQVDRLAPENPHFHLARAETRGYVTLDVQPKRARFDLRSVDPGNRDAGREAVASFVVEAGRRGLQKV
mgnify:CR=1 FL=1